MKAVLQRVKSAQVCVENAPIAEIGYGLLVFIGISKSDTPELVEKQIKRILDYRIFADDNDKMNLSLKQVAGELLIVSQFTLIAATDKGLRPGFSDSAPRAQAQLLYQHAVDQAKIHYHKDAIAAGQFAADMQVQLINDGPVTFILET